MHFYEDLIRIFNDCFFAEYSTCLIKGDEEPIYLPANESKPYNELYFAHGFFSSALHECAHWLLAGKGRRKLVDFGYWYCPDGRSKKEQQLFLQVEVKPQALEWILSQAATYPFRLSLDNLNADMPCHDLPEAMNKKDSPRDLGSEMICQQTLEFKKSIFSQISDYCIHGLPKRAATFREAICAFYGSSLELKIDDFKIENCK